MSTPPNPHLRDFLRRLDALERDRAAIAADTAAIYAEAKDMGFDPEALARAVAWRLMTPPQRAKELERREVVDMYLEAGR